MFIVILYGTESGTAEFVAEDLAERFEDSGTVIVSDMAHFEVGELTAEHSYVIVCATHGEGDLPESAQPFFDALEVKAPDLTGLHYAVFGLGDSSYEDSYGFGGKKLDIKLQELGGARVGEYGIHDASTHKAASDVALEWVETIIPLLRAP